jgi:hypothetical protein
MQNLQNLLLFPLDSFLKGDIRNVKGELKRPFDKALKDYEARHSKLEKVRLSCIPDFITFHYLCISALFKLLSEDELYRFVYLYRRKKLRHEMLACFGMQLLRQKSQMRLRESDVFYNFICVTT